MKMEKIKSAIETEIVEGREKMPFEKNVTIFNGTLSQERYKMGKGRRKEVEKEREKKWSFSCSSLSADLCPLDN